jgi:hypothetical protein
MTSDENARERDAEEETVPPASEQEPAVAEPAGEERQTGEQVEQPEEAAEAEQAAEEEPSGIPPRPLDVYAVLRISVAQLSGIAFQMMGLQADPITNTVRKDLEQARVAIDAAAALVEKLLPHLQGQEARDCENLLNDLRLNFIKQSGEEQKAE